MDKKGLNYIDWILSMGIFLIAVIAIFVFLKPGEQPAFDNNNLMTLVEDGFREATMWEIKQAPLFVRKLVDNYVDNSGVTREAKITISVSKKWGLAITSEGASDLSMSGSSPSFILTCATNVCSDELSELLFYSLDAQNTDLSRLDLECEPAGSVSECDAEIGASESIDGINEQRLENLKTKLYEQVKKEWHIPESKEFALFIDNVELTQGPKPYEQANVFVREMHEWRLSSKGERVPVVINIRVW